MSSKNDLPIPERVLKSFFEEGVIAFVGAGLSMDEGLPSWKGLIERMLFELNEELSELEYCSVKNHIDANDVLLVADFLKFKFGEIRYKKFIESIFLTKKVGKIHKLLTSIPFFGILTTNYDNLLSQSDSLNAFNTPFTWEDADVYRKIKKPFLLHAHGIVSSPGSTILSSTDYDNLNLAAKNITFWEAIRSIFLDRRVIFIGYNLNDPDFNFFLTKLKYTFPGNLSEHHVLIVEKEDDVLNMYRVKDLLGISPIYVSCPTTIGESTFNWLNKLKLELEARETLKKNNQLDSSGQNEQLDQRSVSLKNTLTSFLVENYRTVDSVKEILGSIEEMHQNVEWQDINHFWSGVLFRLPEGGMRKLLSALIKRHPGDGFLKRMLLHIP